jgi:hypothetical protein
MKAGAAQSSIHSVRCLSAEKGRKGVMGVALLRSLGHWVGLPQPISHAGGHGSLVMPISHASCRVLQLWQQWGMQKPCRWAQLAEWRWVWSNTACGSCGDPSKNVSNHFISCLGVSCCLLSLWISLLFMMPACLACMARMPTHSPRCHHLVQTCIRCSNG